MNDPFQAGIVLMGIAIGIVGWLHARRIGVAQAEKQARTAKDDLIASLHARARLQLDMIETDRVGDEQKAKTLEECQRALAREREANRQLADMVEIVYAAELGEEPDTEEGESMLNKSERGQTLVEYGLLIALIAVVVIAALLFLGPIVSGLFNDIGNTIQGAP